MEDKPTPVASPETEPFWEATKDERLLVRRCPRCGHHQHPTLPECTSCANPTTEWVEASGTGRIVSYVVYHRGYHPAFKGDLPYVVALVELEEGPRFLGNVAGAGGDLRCGTPVSVYFEPRGAASIPQFAVRAG